MGIGFDAERIDAIILSLTKIESKYLRLRTENGLLFQQRDIELRIEELEKLLKNVLKSAAPPLWKTRLPSFPVSTSSSSFR